MESNINPLNTIFSIDDVVRAKSYPFEDRDSYRILDFVFYLKTSCWYVKLLNITEASYISIDYLQPFFMKLEKFENEYELIKEDE